MKWMRSTASPGKGRRPRPPSGMYSETQRDQDRQQHHTLHLAQKLPPSRSIRRMAQPQALMLHVRHRLSCSWHDQAHGRRAFAERLLRPGFLSALCGLVCGKYCFGSSCSAWADRGRSWGSLVAGLLAVDPLDRHTSVVSHSVRLDGHVGCMQHPLDCYANGSGSVRFRRCSRQPR